MRRATGPWLTCAACGQTKAPSTFPLDYHRGERVGICRACGGLSRCGGCQRWLRDPAPLCHPCRNVRARARAEAEPLRLPTRSPVNPPTWPQQITLRCLAAGHTVDIQSSERLRSLLAKCPRCGSALMLQEATI